MNNDSLIVINYTDQDKSSTINSPDIKNDDEISPDQTVAQSSISDLSIVLVEDNVIEGSKAQL